MNRYLQVSLVSASIFIICLTIFTVVAFQKLYFITAPIIVGLVAGIISGYTWLAYKDSL